jgi:site-specific recombinase XerD
VIQNHAYLIRRNGIFYFSRRVPADVRARFNKDRVIVSLHTRSLPKAQRSAAALSDRLERYWDSIRLEVFHTRELGLSLVQEVEADRSSVSVSIEDALDSYLRLKGTGRSKTFFQGAARAVGYLTEATSAEELSSLSAADAARFRDHLIGRGMTAASVRRVFGTVKAITNLAIREYGLACPNVFANVFIPDDENASTRLPIPDENLCAIQKECVELDDDVRWLVALISDTGMRLAEAAGLLVSDIKLDADVPHIALRKHPWRSLKTKGSERDIPLVGMSLWAARRIVENQQDFAFPRYTDGSGCNANSASAAINKWLKPRVRDGCVVHSFRHSLRDRLRRVECPSDIADAIGGWATAGVGQKYGSGYGLEVKARWMRAIVSNH